MQKVKTFDTYKDSGIEWIGKIPQNWNIYKIKNLAEISGRIGFKGYTIDDLVDSDTIGAAIVLGGTNIMKEGYISYNKLTYISEYKYLESPEIMLYGGEILITKVGAGTGDNAIYNYYTERVTINPNVMLCKPNNNIINSNYLNYYLLSPLTKAEILIEANKSGAQPAINQQYIKNLFITCPPELEQQEIADYLDKKCGEIDRVVETQKDIIEKLKEYKQSVITEAVTKGLDKSAPLKDSGIEWIGKIPEHWDVRKLKTIGIYRNGLTYSPEDLCEDNEGTLVLRSSNIKNGKLFLGDNVYVKSNIPESLIVQKGDILICSRNGSKELIGKNAIINEDINASFGAFMMIFRCNYPKYMYYILNSHIFNYYLGSFFTSTINQLTGKNFGDMDIVFCPEKKEQDLIVEYLDKKCSEIDSAISNKEQLIEKLTEYKKSLIYECVTGKRKVVA